MTALLLPWRLRSVFGLGIPGLTLAAFRRSKICRQWAFLRQGLLYCQGNSGYGIYNRGVLRFSALFMTIARQVSCVSGFDGLNQAPDFLTIIVKDCFSARETPTMEYMIGESWGFLPFSWRSAHLNRCVPWGWVATVRITCRIVEHIPIQMDSNVIDS